MAEELARRIDAMAARHTRIRVLARLARRRAEEAVRVAEEDEVRRAQVARLAEEDSIRSPPKLMYGEVPLDIRPNGALLNRLRKWHELGLCVGRVDAQK